MCHLDKITACIGVHICVALIQPGPIVVSAQSQTPSAQCRPTTMKVEDEYELGSGQRGKTARVGGAGQKARIHAERMPGLQIGKGIAQA